MILFKQDFTIQKTYIDQNTKNKSFLHISILLKRLGIENNKFMLAITQPELIGVDPHDTSLTKEQKLRIAYECKTNPWYYFREVIRIPTQGSAPVMFKLNRANLAMIWLFYNHFDIFQVIPRQTGKTMTTQAIVSHIIYISGTNISISMLTKDDTLRCENVNRLKDIRDGLPSYLLNIQPRDSDNKQGLSYTAFNNKYITYVAQPEESSADNLGRGMTTPFQHWDEIGMFKNLQITYPIALSSTDAAVETARASGQPCTNILTTTAGKLDTKEGRFAHSLITQAIAFTEKIYDAKDIRELEEIVTLGSSNRMVYIVYSYLQLGKTHEWFKDKTTRSNSTQDGIDRDYLNIWKVGSLKSVITQDILLIIKASQQDPKYVEMIEGYIIRWYIDKYFVENNSLSDVPMILGMDSSENIGRDFTALVLIDARSMELVATCRCNESNIIKMAMFIAKFLIKHTKTLFIPERNSTGTSIIDLLILELQKVNINPYRRIFNQVIQNRDDSAFSNIQIDGRKPIDGSVRKYFGFKTTSSEKSRSYLYKTVLTKALELNAVKIYDSNLIEEITTLTIRNNRIDHTNSGHDDMVISYLLACYVLFAGKNLSFYGIDGKLLLSQVSPTQDTVEANHIDQQISLRTLATELERKINRVNSELVRMTLIRKLNGIKALIDDTIPISPASIISEDVKSNEHKYTKSINTYKVDVAEAEAMMLAM